MKREEQKCFNKYDLLIEYYYQDPYDVSVPPRQKIYLRGYQSLRLNRWYKTPAGRSYCSDFPARYGGLNNRPDCWPLSRPAIQAPPLRVKTALFYLLTGDNAYRPATAYQYRHRLLKYGQHAFLQNSRRRVAGAHYSLLWAPT